tara:strand:+ start:1163 stop:2068 length:906 start_codon:yes stop_codon:yes gene_type:complete
MGLYHPYISVLLPVYNYQNLRPTINSILSQTYENFELLICDDGSTQTLKLPIINDKRIKFYKNEQNIGLGGTLNRLLSFSNKESHYFCTIEQDDLYKPYFLETCVSFLNENQDYGLVSGISEFWDGEKVTYKFPGIIAKGFEYPIGREMFLLNFLEQIKVAQTCMMVRKSVHFDNNLQFSIKYPSLSMDWDYILRFSLISKIKGIQKTFVVQDRRPNRSSLTTKTILVSSTARRLLKDFYDEFPNIITKKDYKYALATQLYRELGNYRFLSRIKIFLVNILLLDPDKKRILKRINKELKII